MPEMAVRVMELGSRPTLFTKARAFAPQGAKTFGEMLGSRDFADAAVVILDWSNVLKAQPDEVAKPVLVLRVAKGYPDLGETLTVESRIAVDDVFGGENIDRSLMLDLVKELGDKVADAYARRKKR